MEKQDYVVIGITVVVFAVAVITVMFDVFVWRP